MYQAACQAYTLDIDRIKSKAVTEGEANNIFMHFESGKQIHEALVKKFGEGEDKTLKTKEFSKEVSVLWGKLLNLQGERWATDMFVKFVEGFDEDRVKEILLAKSVKNGMKKDDIRKSILNQQFNLFIAQEGIKLG